MVHYRHQLDMVQRVQGELTVMALLKVMDLHFTSQDGY